MLIPSVSAPKQQADFEHKDKVTGPMGVRGWCYVTLPTPPTILCLINH